MFLGDVEELAVFTELEKGPASKTKLDVPLWGVLDLRHVFKSKKVLVFGAMEDIANDEILARAKVHPSCFHPSIHFDEFSFSSSYGQISRKHNFCRCILP